MSIWGKVKHGFHHVAHKVADAAKKAKDLGLGSPDPATQTGETTEKGAENRLPGQNDDASTDTEHTA